MTSTRDNPEPPSGALTSSALGATIRALAPALTLLATAVAWIAFEAWAWGAPFAAAFLWSLRVEPAARRRRFVALGGAVAILAAAPIHTGLEPTHFLSLGLPFIAAIALPTWLLRHDRDAEGEPVIGFRLWPRRLDRVDLLYTALSLPLAWAGVQLDFQILAPEVPFNWPLPPEPDGGTLLRLFVGINGVGIWDELFFVNVGYAVLRTLYPARQANALQSVLYTTVLFDMAFRGAGWPLVTVFALTQGAMYERSRVLLWVLIAHLVVDYFLFQAIVEAYYPGLEVWWH
jgi:hypothetical protein